MRKRKPKSRETVRQGVDSVPRHGPLRELEAGIEPLVPPTPSGWERRPARLPQSVEEKFVVR